MNVTLLFRRLTALFLLGMVAMFLSAVGPAAGAHRRHHKRNTEQVTVTPGTGLFVGPTIDQFVTVTWSGFPPPGGPDPDDGYVLLLQCNSHPTKFSDCFPKDESTINGFTRDDGTGTALYQVESTGGKVTCDHSNACTIGVFTKEGDFGSAVFAPIEFASTPDNCPALQTGQSAAAGAGDSSAFRAMLEWEAAVCVKPDLLSVQYSQVTSQVGKIDFDKGIQDFAITTIPFTSDEEAHLTKLGKTYKYAPLTASGMVFAYNIFTHHGSVLGEQVTDLKLTPELLIKIFITNQITNWNDPQILQVNPQYDMGPDPHDRVLPGIIGLSGPASASGSTLEMTSWMDTVARDLYRGAGGGFAAGATDTYPGKAVTWLAGTPDKVALGVAKPSGYDPYQIGYIGWMDSSEAARYGLQTAQIENASGSFRSANSGSLQAALAAGTVRPDGTFVPDYTSNNPDVYPIPTVTDLVAGTNDKSIDAKVGAVVADFLTYAAGDGQNNLPAGYVPLPSSMTDVSNGVVADIPADRSTDSPTPSASASTGTFSSSPFASFSTSPFPSTSPIDVSPIAVASGSGLLASDASPCPVVTEAPAASSSATPSATSATQTPPSSSTSMSGSGGAGGRSGYSGSVLAAAAGGDSPTPDATPSSTAPKPTPTPTPATASNAEPAAASTSPAPAGCVAADSGSGLIPAGAARLVLPGLVLLGAIGLLGPLSRREGGLAGSGVGIGDAKDRLRDLRDRW